MNVTSIIYELHEEYDFIQNCKPPYKLYQTECYFSCVSELNSSNTIIAAIYFNCILTISLKVVFWEKLIDLTQFYETSPYTNRKIRNAKWQHKNGTQNFDYTTIADRLRTVSLSNDIHPTGVVNQLTGYQPSLSSQQLRNRGNEHTGISLQLDLNMYSLQRKLYWKDI